MATSAELITRYSAHTVYLQRIGAAEGLKVRPYLQAIEEDIFILLNGYKTLTITPKREAAIKKQINEISRKHLQEYVAQLKVSNRQVGTYEGEFAATSLDSIIIEDVETVAPSAAQVNAIATATPIKLSEKSYTTYNSMMKNYWVKWSDEIDGIVQAGFITGRTTDQISKQIFEEFGLSKSGSTKSTLDRAMRSAKQLAITGTNHYANTARVAFVDVNDKLLTGYRSIAVVDSNTSQICRSLDGDVIAKDDPRLSSWMPPRHINCRSAAVYEVNEKYKLDDDSTQRASRFEVDDKLDPKPISSKQTYYDAMGKLSDTDQDNILGSKLGKAFRKMNNPEEFAKATRDTLFNPLSIAEMTAKDNELGRILKAQK